MGVLLSLFFGFMPMFLFAYFVYWLDRYEKEPKLLLGVVFFWGAVVAAGAAFLVNTTLGLGVYMFTQSETATELTTGSVIAPIIEETLKGLAVLLVFIVFRREFDSVLDGLVYAAICALGFAATENTYYIYKYGYVDSGMSGLFALVFIRVILVGWQHPFYTAFTGIGLAAARLSRNGLVKVGAPLIGWFVAVSTHAIHNTLASVLSGAGGRVVGTFIDWSGWLAMFIFILYMISRERKMIIKHLAEEVSLGNITSEQYKTASSAWSQTAARLGAIAAGKFSATSRFYQVCGEIAHKKRQLVDLGDESGNATILENLRTEVRGLSPKAAS